MDGGAPQLALGPDRPIAVLSSVAQPDGTAAGRWVTVAHRLGPDLVPGPLTALRLPRDWQLWAVPSGAIVDLRGRIVLPGALSVAGRTVDGFASGTLGGTWSVRRVPGIVRDVAVNAAGDAAVLVEPCAKGGCRPAAPSLYLSRRGGAFRTPLVLDRRGRGYGAALALDARGRVLAVWDRDGRIYARFVSAAGRLGPIRALGRERTTSQFTVVLADDGRAAIGAVAQRINEGYAATPFTATLWLAGPAGRFGRGRVLETVRVTGMGRYVPYGGLQLALPARAPGLVTWTGHAGGRFVVRAATLTGASAGPRQTLSDPAVHTVLADAATGPDGRAVVLMLARRKGIGTGRGGSLGLQAVARPPGGAFGPIETIVAGDAYIDGADVGLDAASGRAIAVWRDVGGPPGWAVRDPG